MQVQKDWNGIENMPQGVCQQLEESSLNSSVLCVEKSMKASKLFKNIVLSIVNMLRLWLLKRIMKNAFVVFAKLYTVVINTMLQKHVVKSVQVYCVQEQKEVFDLTIDIDNCYYANGYLVSNCDCIRYLALSLPKVKDGSSPEELEQRYRSAMYGDQGNLPHIFRS
jgi:ethanolamine transporter EutH